MTTFWRKVVVGLGYCGAGLVIFAALLVSVTRLLTPLLNDHLVDFEQFVGRLLNRPVHISKVEIAWNFYEPELFFHHVVLLDQQTQKPSVEIPFIKVDIAIFNSLFSREIVLDSLKVTGVHLTLRQQKSGEVSVDGFSLTDNLTGHPVDPNVILAWVFSQPKLIVQNFELRYIASDGLEKLVILKWLMLNNSDRHHHLAGKAMLSQKIPTQITINFKWEGDVRHLADVSANLYLYLESVSLPEWFGKRNWRNLLFKQGIGNAKIWADWNHNQWQKIRSQLQFYNIQTASLATHKNLTISHVSGNVQWERQGNTQLISGDHFLIDLPNHLWPVNAFSIKLSDPLALQSFTADYIDLADTKKFLEASGLLPTTEETQLLLLNPKGELRELQVDHLNKAISDITLSAKFSGLTFNTWKNFPAVSNLQGAMQWDGQRGELKLNSPRTTIAFNTIFQHPLMFDQLHVSATLQKEASGSWVLTAKNTQVINQDLNAKVNLSLNFPVDNSPEINLTGDFTLAHADHINDYLPLKSFEPGLVTWLHHAFSGGQVEKGQAIVHGRLSDFPFEEDKGKFVISGFVKNMNLNYAPDWPKLQNLNAKLIFSGKGMTVDVISAQLLGIPIKMTHAEIPNLGTNPILTTTSIVKTDMTQGLRFVEQSPLRDTVGKHLSGLDLKGPMQLNLGLIIPLNHTDETQVTGDTLISQATLNLPAWNLTLSELNGAFRFTENTLTATNLTGKLLGYPVALKLATENAKSNTSSVIATLQGTLDTKQLGTWLNLPIENVLQGSTTYQATLHLPSKPSVTQIVLDSNLQGIRVDLPANYGKAAQDSIDFKLTLVAEDKEPLKIKIDYNKLFSLAFVLEKEQQQFSLVSANINLGKGGADWQTQPGIVVTGNIDYLDWSKIQPYVAQFTEKKSIIKTKVENRLINPDRFRALDIRANLFDFSGFKLKDLRIQLTKTANNFVLELNNANMDGQIILPQAGIQQGVDAKFQRLIIPNNLPTGKNIIDPRKLPAISFVGYDVRYEDMQLGRVTIELVPAAGGLSIRQFDLQSPVYQLQAKGIWTNVSSRLQGNVTTKNISDLLKAWGFSSANLVGSTGSADFNLNWTGGLLSSLRAVSGTVSLKLGEGRIINLGESTDAKIGFARLLNILSLQNLPRRLSLHFNDLFEKGYSFDYVKGDFALQNGNAVTQNTRINGPIAGIAIVGRIGLAAKDLDLKLGVTPYVTSSLPVVAAIATANPVAGVATWVVDKMVTGAMSQMTTYNYSIQGSWANPVWNQVSTQKH